MDTAATTLPPSPATAAGSLNAAKMKSYREKYGEHADTIKEHEEWQAETKRRDNAPEKKAWQARIEAKKNRQATEGQKNNARSRLTTSRNSARRNNNTPVKGGAADKRAKEIAKRRRKDATKKSDRLKGGKGETAGILDPREQLRIWLDRTTFAAGLTVKGLVIAWLIITVRAIVSVTFLKDTTLGALRYTAKNVFQMVPNAQKMSPMTFTPMTGAATSGILTLILLAVAIMMFVTFMFPFIMQIAPFLVVGGLLLSIF